MSCCLSESRLTSTPSRSTAEIGVVCVECWVASYARKVSKAFRQVVCKETV